MTPADFVHAVDLVELPLAAGHPSNRGAIALVAVQVLPAVAFAQPEKAAVFQPGRRAQLAHPRLGGLAKQRLRGAPGSFTQIEVEPGLLAVLHLVDDVLAVGRPPDIHDQMLGRSVLRRVHPLHVAAGGLDDPQPGRGVGVARLRVVGGLDVLPVREVIHDGELGHGRLVELKEGEARGVRAPPVRAVRAASVDLFLVHPIEPSVQPLRVAVGRERPLVALEVHDVQVVLADESDEPAIRAERHFVLGRGRPGQPSDALGAEGPEEQVVCGVDEQRRSRRVHHIRRWRLRRAASSAEMPGTAPSADARRDWSNSGVSVPVIASTRTISCCGGPCVVRASFTRRYSLSLTQV